VTAGWTIGVGSPGKQSIFPLASVSRAALIPTSLLPNGSRDPFPGSKVRSERDADHSPHLGQERVGAIHSDSLSANMGCCGTDLRAVHVM
jgi:hypothetical protein